jgi:uncharacterized protein YjbJ (UPF0337 family)
MNRSWVAWIARPVTRQPRRDGRQCKSASRFEPAGLAGNVPCSLDLASRYGARERRKEAADATRCGSDLPTRGNDMDYPKKDDSVGEELGAFGQRVKGAAKDAAGAVSGNRRLEREGEIENAEGRERQARNNVFDETDGVPGATVSDRRRVDLDGDEDADDAVDDIRGRAATRTAATAGTLVTGLYDTPASASRAYDALTTRHGYAPSDINVLMTDDTRQRHFGDVAPGTELSGGTKAAEGLGKGAAIGGGVGAALAAIFAVGTTVVVPGLGLVVAGPIAAALAGAGAGGATGGIIGALIGAGIPEERVTRYTEGLGRGGIVIGTRARDERHAAELERDFREYGGSDVVR